MDKNVALEIVLSEVCCSNGELCEICPLKEKNCGEVSYSTEELVSAIKVLSNL